MFQFHQSNNGLSCLQAYYPAIVIALFLVICSGSQAQEEERIIVSDTGPRLYHFLPYDDHSCGGIELKDAEANAIATEGWTSLTLAVLRGDLEQTSLLLEQGGDVNAQDHFGRSLLLLAIEYGKTEMARFLIEHGAEVNAANPKWKTPLHAAIFWPDTELLKLLIAKDANIKANTNEEHQLSIRRQQAPLHLAVKAGNVDAVRVLFAHGVQPSSPNNYGKTPLHYAAQLGHVEIARLLMEHGARVGEKAELSERRELARRYFLSENWTPLHFAAVMGQGPMVRYLVQCGAKLDAVGFKSSTPLHNVAKASFIAPQESKEMIELLISLGAKVNARDESGFAPLINAALNENLVALKALAANGASINAQAANGVTAIYQAARLGNYDIAEFLLSKGADASLEIYNSQTGEIVSPAQAAQENGHFALAKLLEKEAAKTTGAKLSENREKLLKLAAEDKDKKRKPSLRIVTETIFETENYDETKTITTEFKLDLEQYRIERDAKLSPVDSEYAAYASYDFYLIFAGRTERIYLGDCMACRFEDRDKPEEMRYQITKVARRWLGKGSLLELQVEPFFAGTGGVHEKNSVIYRLEDDRLQEVFRAAVRLYHRMGPSAFHHSRQKIDFNPDTKTMTIIQDEQTSYRWETPWYLARRMNENSLKALPIGSIVERHLAERSEWRYHFNGVEFEYQGGEKYAMRAVGFPLIDVAEKYALTLPELLALNPSQQNRIFANGRILLDDKLGPYRSPKEPQERYNMR